MKSKYLFKIFIIGFMIFSCGDDGSNCPGEIVLPISICPHRSYYNIGDTILITSKFNKLIFDKKTDRFYDASNFNFGPLASFYSLDNAETNLLGSQVMKYCNLINMENIKMNIINTGNQNAISVNYNLADDSIYFQIKLEVKKIGYFWLKFESLTSGDSHLQNNHQFNCRGREIKFNLETPIENNIEIMQKFRPIYPNDYFLSDSINRFYNYAGYCFEVR